MWTARSYRIQNAKSLLFMNYTGMCLMTALIKDTSKITHSIITHEHKYTLIKHRVLAVSKSISYTTSDRHCRTIQERHAPQPTNHRERSIAWFKLQTLVYDTLPSGGRCRKAVFGVWAWFCLLPLQIDVSWQPLQTMRSWRFDGLYCFTSRAPAALAAAAEG